MTKRGKANGQCQEREQWYSFSLQKPLSPTPPRPHPVTQPRPNPNPTQHPETDPKRSQTEPNGAETDRNGAEMDRNQALWDGTARGFGMGGVVREKENHEKGTKIEETQTPKERERYFLPTPSAPTPSRTHQTLGQGWLCPSLGFVAGFGSCRLLQKLVDISRDPFVALVLLTLGCFLTRDTELSERQIAGTTGIFAVTWWKLPCPSVPWFLGLYQGKPQIYQGFFFPCRTHKSLKREEKTPE